MEEVCTVSEQTGEETLHLSDCGCAPKFSPQPAFILYIACAKTLSSDRKNYGFAFVLIIFLFYLAFFPLSVTEFYLHFETFEYVSFFSSKKVVPFKES